MPKHFIRKKEDFTCEVCGTKVKGTGYTNHCPNCLWSKHVDKDVPGDRYDTCQGIMEPVGVEINHGEYSITHCCQNCGKISKNKTEENDNFEEILEIANQKASFVKNDILR